MEVTDHSVTSRTIAQHIESVTHHSVSARTIRRRLQLSGQSARRPLLGLPLTQNHRRLHRQWCDERRMWAAEWNEVVFTDESHICMQYPDGRIRVWKHRGERMLNSCVMHRHTGPAPCIMVWGGIGYHSRTPLVRIAGTLNSQRYISKVLEPVVLPYLQGLATSIFQQDNARPYVAHIFQRFFVNHQIELCFPGRLSLGSFADRKHVVYGCSTIDPDYTPQLPHQITLATCGSCLSAASFLKDLSPTPTLKTPCENRGRRKNVARELTSAESPATEKRVDKCRKPGYREESCQWRSKRRCIRIAKHTSRWAEVCRPRRIDPRRERRLLLTVRPDRKAISADISCSFYNSDSRQCTSTHSEPYTAAYGPTQPPLKSHNPADGMSSPTAPATSRVTSVMDHIRIEEWCRYYGWHRYYNMGVDLIRHIRTPPRLHRTIIDVCALREHHCRPGAPVHGNSIPCE
ncbi:transposable element Tcb1 transposase [Trichonephila clavipes]|nr:transposable element Tcb1 transposase [Trichonephila clavipes]